MRDYAARKPSVSARARDRDAASAAKCDRECLTATAILLILLVFVSAQLFAASMREAEQEREIARKWSRDTSVDATIDQQASPHIPLDPSSIDVVFSYVDGADAEWQRNLRAVLGDDARIDALPFANRYREWGELRYAMRSVDMYAPWVRRIFLVVASPSQLPTWLDVRHERIKIVFHSELVSDAATQLPTFNSLVIESFLHHIPELSEHFLYFNNGTYVFLAAPVALSDFVTTTHYVRYRDWPIRVADACATPRFVRNSQQDVARQHQLDTLHEDLVAGRNTCGEGESFFWNRALSAFYYSEPPSHWFAHVPHLFERRVLFRVERDLNKWLIIARRNRVRRRDTDLSMFILYESYLQSASDAHSKTERRVHTIDLQSRRRAPQVNGGSSSGAAADGIDGAAAPLYHYATFGNADSDAFYSNLDCVLQRQPRFFSIDDDLHSPTSAVVAFHQRRLLVLFARHWTKIAPWEIDQGGALRVDDRDEAVMRTRCKQARRIV